MKETDTFWNVIPIDIEKYKEGAIVSNTGGLCYCEGCVILRKKRDEINELRKGPKFSTLLELIEYSADVTKDKLSLIVNSPGFYGLSEIASHTDNRFSYIYFPTVGKFSLVSLYKAARSASELPPLSVMFSDDEVAETVGLYSDLYLKVFSKVFVYGSMGDNWNSMKNRIHDIVSEFDNKGGSEKELAATKVNYENVYRWNDRYILMFHFDGVNTTILSEDGTNKISNEIPGLPTYDAKKSWRYVLRKAKELPKCFGFADDKHVIPYAFDTETNSLVTGVLITDAIHNIVNANKEKFSSVISNTFAHVLSPALFADAIKLDFAKNGADELSITEFWPKLVTARWSQWSTGGDTMNYSVTHPGYLAAVSLNGKPLIGKNGSNNGNVHIRFNPETGRPGLIKSPWCQRLSAWSKYNHGVIDQLYDIWPLADWLTGPFAEKASLQLKKSPLLFSGNQITDRRKQALDKIKAKIK